MSKKREFDDDILIDQPEIGCYYHNNMFRFPEEELMRPQPPMNKPMNQPMNQQPMYQQPLNKTMNQPMPQQMVSPMVKGKGGMMQDPDQPSGTGPSGSQGGMPPLTEGSMEPPVLTNIGFTQAYLKTLIGRRVRVSFLIGTSLLVDRVGTLLEVGISYIVLRQIDSNINVMADLYAIKFVDIYNA